ncbi:MAG: type II toxin-antitoxin system RelE/ParE family toxin [Acidobacteria bacterium]|nr:type II toxin-antitoxin system RelE/ParE family toxin [Acidobacteriota bacterium]
MFIVSELPVFTQWMDGLKDAAVIAAIVTRIRRMEQGLFGDAKLVGSGVSELRIHLGAGWRVYYTQRRGQIIILLAGGSKRTQNKDIKRAIALAKAIEEER